jgi:hypothetical protein
MITETELTELRAKKAAADEVLTAGERLAQAEAQHARERRAAELQQALDLATSQFDDGVEAFYSRRSAASAELLAVMKALGKALATWEGLEAAGDALTSLANRVAKLELQLNGTLTESVSPSDFESWVVPTGQQHLMDAGLRPGRLAELHTPGVELDARVRKALVGADILLHEPARGPDLYPIGQHDGSVRLMR